MRKVFVTMLMINLLAFYACVSETDDGGASEEVTPENCKVKAAAETYGLLDGQIIKMKENDLNNEFHNSLPSAIKFKKVVEPGIEDGKAWEIALCLSTKEKYIWRALLNDDGLNIFFERGLGDDTYQFEKPGYLIAPSKAFCAVKTDYKWENTVKYIDKKDGKKKENTYKFSALVSCLNKNADNTDDKSKTCAEKDTSLRVDQNVIVPGKESFYNVFHFKKGQGIQEVSLKTRGVSYKFTQSDEIKEVPACKDF